MIKIFIEQQIRILEWHISLLNIKKEIQIAL